MGFFSTPFVVLMSELWHFPSCNEIFGLKMAKFSLSRNVALPILPRVIQENSNPHFLRVPATGEGSEKSYPIRASKILGNGTHIWKQEFYIPAIGCGTLIFQLFSILSLLVERHWILLQLEVRLIEDRSLFNHSSSSEKFIVLVSLAGYFKCVRATFSFASL